MNEIMWAVDVEGSGKSPPEIVELAIAEMKGLTLTGRRKHWRFKPKKGISPMASHIHGIWDEDVVDAPDIEDVADDVLMWLEDKAIVGHNVKVEVDILSQALEGWEPTAAYDTLKIARRLLPAEEKHGLEYQVVDMRWGVRDEMTDEHMTTALCMNELRGCQKYSMGPNFIYFGAQK